MEGASEKSKSFTNELGVNQVFRNPRFLGGVAVGAFAATALFAQQQSEVVENNEIDRGVSVGKDKLKFEEWMRKHGRVYKDENEKQERFLIFQDKLRFIESHSTATFKIPLDLFSDRTFAETQEEVRLLCEKLPLVLQQKKKKEIDKTN